MGAYGFSSDKKSSLIKKVKKVIKVSKKKRDSKKKSPSKIYTEREVYLMTKEEQIKILKSYGVKKIPRYEIDRINLIMELQGETHGQDK